MVAGLEDFYDDAGTATALAADLAAAVAHGEERGVGAGDALIELEVAVGFERVEAMFELGEEVVDLGKVSVLPLLFFFFSLFSLFLQSAGSGGMHTLARRTSSSRSSVEK